MRRGTYRAYCFRCMCEWETAMVETAPGEWRAEVFEGAGDLQVCQDCGSWLVEPDSIEAAA